MRWLIQTDLQVAVDVDVDLVESREVEDVNVMSQLARSLLAVLLPIGPLTAVDELSAKAWHLKTYRSKTTSRQRTSYST